VTDRFHTLVTLSSVKVLPTLIGQQTDRL